MESQTKLNNLIRSDTVDKSDTKMTQSQPLNEIRMINSESSDISNGISQAVKTYNQTRDNALKQFEPLKNIVKLSGSCQDDIALEYSKESSIKKSEDIFKDGCDMICEQCQIKDINGNCRCCGLYQYGEQFEVKIRRRL